MLRRAADLVAFQLRQGDAPGPLELLDGVVLQQALEVVDLLRAAGQHDGDAVGTHADHLAAEDAHQLYDLGTLRRADGDGCFQMTAQELVTASSEQIPVKIAILNNAYLGMVRQWQEMFYEERYSEVYLSPDLPDYVKWAEAMGCVGIKAETPEDVGPAIEKANSIDDRPVVVDFRTDAFEKVYPMVAAGSSNDDIVVHPDQLAAR